MNILVTAGNTLVMIDQVRAITNIFTGRTGAQIALCAHDHGHAVTLLTSHPEVVAELRGDGAPLLAERWTVRPYRTFDDLRQGMEELIRPGRIDAVVHCAAVSDYQSGGIFAPAKETRFDPDSFRWEGDGPVMEDRSAGKVKSDEPGHEERPPSRQVGKAGSAGGARSRQRPRPRSPATPASAGRWRELFGRQRRDRSTTRNRESST